MLLNVPENKKFNKRSECLGIESNFNPFDLIKYKFTFSNIIKYIVANIKR